MPQYSEIVDVIAASLKRDPGTLEMDVPLEALDVDSIDVVEIVFSVEEKFGIEIPFNANSASNPAFATLGSVVALIQDLANAAHAKSVGEAPIIFSDGKIASTAS